MTATFIYTLVLAFIYLVKKLVLDVKVNTIKK